MKNKETLKQFVTDIRNQETHIRNAVFANNPKLAIYIRWDLFCSETSLIRMRQYVDTIPTILPEYRFDKAVINYAITKGIDEDDLTLKDFQYIANQINNDLIYNDLGAESLIEVIEKVYKKLHVA